MIHLLAAVPVEQAQAAAVHVDWAAAGTAAAAVFTALGLSVVGIISAVSRARAEARAAEAAMVKTTDEIKAAVNGNASAAAAKLKSVEDKLGELYKELARLQSERVTAADLRAARAEIPTVRAADPEPAE